MTSRTSSLFRTARARAILVVPLMLVALWLTVPITASAVVARLDPDTAVRLDPANSRALERGASLAAVDTTPASARRAIALATRALLASPMSGEGAAALGTARLVLNPGADVYPAFRYSRFLTRRTPLTELWFIEYLSAKGDVAGALQTYDHLFRVSDYYREQFLPVLVTASAEPEVARGMTRVLATRPPWRNEYYSGLLGTFPGPEQFLALVRAFRFDPRDAEDVDRLSLAMMRLVQAKRADLAYNLYRAVARRPGPPAFLRDGDFRHVGAFAPFDWMLTQSDELVATPGTNDAGASVLQLSNRGGRPGVLARQLLLLPAGRYRLTFAVGDVAGEGMDRPRMQVTCADAASTLSDTLFPVAPAAGRDVRADFAVPSQGCAAQWLTVQAGNPVDAIANQEWVGDIAITAMGGAVR